MLDKALVIMCLFLFVYKKVDFPAFLDCAVLLAESFKSKSR